MPENNLEESTKTKRVSVTKSACVVFSVARRKDACSMLSAGLSAYFVHKEIRGD
jgi:hypothetical protein